MNRVFSIAHGAGYGPALQFRTGFLPDDMELVSVKMAGVTQFSVFRTPARTGILVETGDGRDIVTVYDEVHEALNLVGRKVAASKEDGSSV